MKNQKIMKNKKEEYLSKKKEKEEKRSSQIRLKRIKKIAFWALLIFFIVGGIFLWQNNLPEKNQSDAQEKPKITVLYSPDCICCVRYIPYLKRKGFNVLEEKDMAKRIDILEENQIPHEMSSCHTSIVGDYFVEGHIPAEVINELLEEKPEINGIALPGMPQGSPGMPGFKTEEWKIYSFIDGVSSEFMLH